MPKIERVFTLEITPSRYVEACDDTELQELELEMQREFARRRIIAEQQQPKLIIDEQF